MRLGRRASIRSHRAKRRKIVAPWIVATTVTVVVATALTTGYSFLLRPACRGSVTATIAAAPNVATHLQDLARSWADDQPTVGGKCASVEVESKDSATVATALGGTWQTKTDGPAPDVWVPDSTVWVRKATLNPTIAAMVPQKQPSIARTLSVIAMPRPMAEALGWPRTELSWQSLINDVAGNGWERFDKPEWGAFRVGMPDPNTSTAALLALMAISGADGDTPAAPEGLAAVDRLKQIRTPCGSTTDQILTDLARADRAGEEAVLQYLSAFPALETDVLSYNRGNPNVPLVAVYPTTGTADADNPYLVLNADWSRSAQQKVAQEFLTYLRGETGRAAFLDTGYRDANRVPGRGLTEENGVSPKVLALPRTVLLPEMVEDAVRSWAA